MNSREKVRSIFDRKSNGEGALWIGHPNPDFVPVFANQYGLEENSSAISEYLKDDCKWITADSIYTQKRPPFDSKYGMEESAKNSTVGCFAEAEEISDLDSYPWQNPDDIDFTSVIKEVEMYKDKMVFTGMWSCFYHNVADFFGMENYFVNMYTNPKLVDALTQRVVDYYVKANETYFELLGDKADVMFFGNDFGTQLDLFISPENFRRFILPSLKRLIAVGKKYNKKIMMHSCGSIYRIIPDLIDAGLDVLHPLQASAVGMSAKELAKYKNDLAFVGGIDAQTFFVNSTPQQIKDEVYRVRDILGPNIVISPSHEEILPNVPPENLVAMAQAALS